MKPRKYELRKDKKLKPVFLDLREDGDGILTLVAVDSGGGIVACLQHFKENVIESLPLAKCALDGLGYDTSFCRWDADGAVLLN